MSITAINTPRTALNKAYKRQPVQEAHFSLFISELQDFLDKVDIAKKNRQTEEHLKGLLKEFLTRTHYPTHYINTKSYKGQHEADLAVHLGKSTKDPLGLLLELKSPGSGDMPREQDINRKGLHEAVLYYLWEKDAFQNHHIKHIIITDCYEWYIFDATEFHQAFWNNKKLRSFFTGWRNGSADALQTADAYQVIKELISREQLNLHFTYFNLNDYRKWIGKPNEMAERELILLYKMFSAQHLLKEPFENDSNQLNREFYNELLYIIGLEEVKEGSKKLIRRKKDPNPGALLENAILKIQSEGLLENIKNISDYGETEEQQLYNIGLELCITWINRILFLKLLEAQLQVYHSGNKDYKFLSPEKIVEFDTLNTLYFEVLALPQEKRTENTISRFPLIPYLNSSLFEPTTLERHTLRISNLKDNLKLPMYSRTIFTNKQDKRLKGEELSTLEYLLRFLEAYDFGAEDEMIQREKRPLINAAVLGLIFEKINGYKEGSFYTPGFITMYMSRETVSRAVVDKFNQRYSWDCQDLKELHNSILRQNIPVKEANEVINSLAICDPAVGSGHFLVSVLNELIRIKNELGILSAPDGKVLRGYSITVENDELQVETNEQEIFRYKLGANGKPSHEDQQMQETLFEEKRHLIENCLFGVDINPNSVKICRLRLWIELLKNAYYTRESDYRKLETLPNIDINIKQGNSLISRFALDADLKTALKSIKYNINDFKGFVKAYKESQDREERKGLLLIIDDIKKHFRTTISQRDKVFLDLKKAEAELYLSTADNRLFDYELEGKAREKEKQKVRALEAQVNKLHEKWEEKRSGEIYRNAFEWRFEFPEVLDEEGNFKGFDVVIGNPPYVSLSKIEDQEKTYLQIEYSTYSKTTDIYCLFYEMGGEILKANGLLTYITSNSWLRATYGNLLKSYFEENLQPLLLMNIEDIQVFEEATVESNIITLKKEELKNSFPVVNLSGDYLFGSSLADYFYSHYFEYTVPESGEWVIEDAQTNNLKLKIENNSKRLLDYNISINFGIKTGLNEAFLIDDKVKANLLSIDPKNAEIIKPLLRGRDIKKYHYDFEGVYLLNVHNGLKDKSMPRVNVIKEYPTIYKYLEKFLPKINIRYDKGDHWSNLRNCAYLEEFDKSKIIWGEISDKPKFAYDDLRYFAEATTFIMTGEKLKYLLAILNSKVSEWYFKLIGTTTGMGTNRWKKYKIELLPIKVPSEKQELELENLVDKIIKIKKENPSEDTIDLEKEIDQQVYELYGLTEEEIKIVEAKL